MSYRYDPKEFRGSKARFSKAQSRRNWLGRVFYGSEWFGKPVVQAKAAFEFMRTWWGGLR